MLYFFWAGHVHRSKALPLSEAILARRIEEGCLHLSQTHDGFHLDGVGFCNWGGLIRGTVTSEKFDQPEKFHRHCSIVLHPYIISTPIRAFKRPMNKAGNKKPFQNVASSDIGF